MVDQIIPEPPAAVTPAAPVATDELAAVELSLLLEALVRWSGYDFRDFAPALIKRRIAERMRAEGVSTISGLQERVLHDHEALRRFVFAMSTSPNRLFRAPEYFRAFRSKVVPFLRTYSFMRLWFPSCATGEDVYTIASILFEEGLHERCMIYATEVSEIALAQAREGVYPASSVEDLANDYRLTGGNLALSALCETGSGTVTFNDELRKNIIFARHSLATDASLNEFHGIIARGIMPQYNKTLQYRVHNLFLQSLTRFGFLCLSSAESLHATPHEGAFRKVDDAFPLYRRMR